MSMTDILNLNTSHMFEKIRSGLPIELGRTQNLLESKDDLLYAWNSCDSCLLAINWRAAKLKGFSEIKYQTLIPSTQQTFQVERVLASIEGSLIALAGSHGVTLLELPRRWGPNGQFMEGKDTITCRSSNIDAQFFYNNSHTEVRQLRWHPASPTDSHLLVLLSDNTIRVYENCNLRHVWQIGPFPSSNITSASNSSTFPTPYVLGESAVDFDISPPISTHCDSTLNQENSSSCGKMFSEKVEWPIVILRENGNIYILSAGIDTDKPRLQGPLTIKPKTDSNYGLDSCSILVIPSLPPTFVIAETTGKLHHALLLEAKVPEESFNEIDSSLVIHPSEWTINVLETVELELGIPEVQKESSYSCPIYLKSDSINEMRYFAYHNAGLHVVTINFIEEMERYLDSDVVSDLSNFSNSSRSEYLVCTKINNNNKVNAILGFVLLQMPSGIVLLLSSGQVISLNMVIDSKLLPLTHIDAKTSCTKINTLNEQPLGPSFVDHIKNILKRSVTQPIVSINKSAQPTPQEMYELLTQTMEVLRNEYIKKHEEARGDYLQRLNAIKIRKEQQKKDIEILERERDLIRENAHRLAERFEEISENQELLSRKCQDLVRLANTCLPNNTQAEKEFSQEVEKINNQAKMLINAPQKAKQSITKQCYHIQKYMENTKNKPFYLPGKQEATIKEILLQMTAEIDGQVREVKRINNILNL